MEPSDYKFKTKPYEHQHRCFNGSCRSKYFALLLDMGTGKTKIALDTAAYMYDNGWINAVMVFGNNGSYMNWVEAIEEHLPDHIQVSVGVWSSKNSKRKIEEMNKAISKPGMQLTIFLMNIEAIAFEKGYAAAYAFTKAHNTLAIVDESTTIANPQASRTKAAWKIGAVARARRILSGSSVDNRPLDAWAQFQFLCNGALGFTSYYAFRAQYAELEDMTFRQGGVLRSVKTVKGFKNLDALKNSMSKISFIVKKEDCLDLPKRTYMDYNVELTTEQKKLYESLKERSIAELEGKTVTREKDLVDDEVLAAILGEQSDVPTVTVKLAITKMLRLHQLVCGHLKDDNGIFHEVDNNRLKALEDVIEEANGRIVIWTSFTYDVNRIANFLKKKYGQDSTLTYHGATSNEERARVKEVFKRGQEVDGLRFLVANDKTGGYGNNFTAITTAIYYSYDFDNNVHHQTQDRIHRIGQTEPCTYVYLKAKDTIDEKILAVLKGKMTLAELLTPSNWKENFI